MKRVEDIWFKQRMDVVRKTCPELNKLNDYELAKVISERGLNIPLFDEDAKTNSLKIRIEEVNQEHDLRNGIYEFLQSQKIFVIKEKACCNGRYFADLVTNNVIIECKYILDRHSLHMARGQAHMYAHDLKKSKIVIAGLICSRSNFQSSQSKKLIETFGEQGIEIWGFHATGKGAICKIGQVTLNTL
jgi:UDP-glucose 6-dehydrogenase